MKKKWVIIGAGVFASFWAAFYTALTLADDEAGEVFYRPPRSRSD